MHFKVFIQYKGRQRTSRETDRQQNVTQERTERTNEQLYID